MRKLLEGAVFVWKDWLNLAAVGAVIAAMATIVVRNLPGGAPDQLINVSYDPTRELYKALNPLFVRSFERETSRRITIVQSHGGSSRQAQRIISGELPADVVTLALYPDVDGLRKRGLVGPGWADRLPNRSSPYSSTIVFVVRRGNPRHVMDWPDLLQPGIEIITPDPRTSGNGKLVALAAWAAITTRGGTEAQALAYLRSMYQHSPVLEEGARGAALVFTAQEVGDVHLTWESEAIREAAEGKDKLQIVYPPVSILAEPHVAWVDRSVKQPERLAAAKAYLSFLFSDVAQETIARLGYRPYKKAAAAKASASFPSIKLVPITVVARDWDDVSEKFFAENGIIDSVLGKRQR